MQNQRNEQALNETLATLREQLARQIDDQQRAEGALAEARRPLVMEFEAASRRHRRIVAGIKVAVLRQRREAYEGFRCPTCGFPIRRGPLRFMARTAHSIARVSRPIEAATDEPYTCPSCVTPLFVACRAFGRVRHALLPACDHCGDVVPQPE